MARIVSFLAVAALAGALRTSNLQFAVLPPPRSILQTSAAALAWTEAPSVRILGADALSQPALARLQRGVDRFLSRAATRLTSPPATRDAVPVLTPTAVTPSLDISIARGDEVHLSITTSYEYTLVIQAGTMSLSSPTLYGALAGLESLLQLVEVDTASHRLILPHGSVTIDDAPTYAWRGLMLDTGRRFFPLPTLQNLLDTMQAAKMSVLHLHASDHCRFSVESKLYPNLTAALTGVLGGFYTQADIGTLIAYANDRGIRVVPEFDVPGHSRGFLPLIPEGIQFCDPQDATVSQLYGDPANKTLNILQALFGEMAGLFNDDVFHIGCDETGVVGPCTTESTFSLERTLLQYITTKLGKTPAGWEEVLFDADAATNNTIVDTWSQDAPNKAILLGNRVVDSNASHFYFTDPAPGGPSGWSPCWYDIGTGVPAANLSMLLGGEASMWTDTYCYIDQCGSSNGPTPNAAALFPPEQDAAFSASIGGMIWPRGLVAASAFWNYNASVSPSDPAFVAAVWSLNDQLVANGSYTCPTNCSCDQLTACGVPYIKPTPPAPGTSVTMQQCSIPAGPGQAWTLTSEGYLQLQSDASLCMQTTPSEAYPLIVGPCTGNGAAPETWTHNALAHFVAGSDGDCLDQQTSTGDVGTWQCGSGSGLNQPNQEWSLDPVTGLLTTPLVASQGGMCATAGGA